MTDRQWQTVLRLYNSALDKPETERLAFVRTESTGDSEVTREVLEMLELREEPEPAPPDTPERVGSRIGRYEVGRRIGRGGMGEVFEARDLDLGRQVAIKFLLPEAAGGRATVQRFVREARTISALNHPNILTVFEVIPIEGGFALATELVRGRPLSAFRGSPVPSSRLMDWARQIASALAAAHREGIVHRDLKPENLMLREDGYIKVLDFGLARDLTQAPGAAGTPDSTLSAMAGTPRYMSPEQMLGGGVTPASDIFSLGVALYELATGRHPFEAAHSWETVHAMHFREPDGLAERTTRIPGLDSLILRMLAKRPEERPTAAQIASALDSLPAKGNRRLWGTLTACAALAAAVGWWAWSSRSRAPGPALRLVPLTSSPGSKDFAAFSPDGSRIAFSWSGAGGANRHIYLKAVASRAQVQLTSGPADDTWPAWSRDGGRVAFVRRMPDGSRAVYVVPANGGDEQRVWVGGEGVSWSPDGKHLAVAAERPPKGSGGLILLSLETGERRQLTAPLNSHDGYPVFSRNGRSIAFMRELTERELFVVPSAGGNAVQLTSDAKPKLPGLSWTPGDGEILYSMMREYGGAGLWRVPAAGGAPRPLDGILPFAGNPSVSPDGTRVAFTENWLDTNIYVSRGPGISANGSIGALREGQKLIASSREDHSPSFSPGGNRIAFVSNRSGHSEIWTANGDGHGETQLTHFNGFTGTPRWSPDGRSIAFDSMSQGRTDIWLIGAGGGSPHRLTSGPGNSGKPAWSPDGAWVYFNSNRSGPYEIWRVTADGRRFEQITWHGAREPLASSDGQTVYYTKKTGGAPVWQVPAGGGPEHPVAHMESYDRIGRAWGVIGTGIYFASATQAENLYPIRYFHFATGRVSPLQAWQEKASWVGPVALSPDGKTLLTVRTDQQVNDLMLLENFR